MKRKWKKILYEDQGVADNYVDASFLDELRKNLYNRPYNYWSVVVASGAVTQQICSVCLFLVVFIHLDDDVIPAVEVSCVSGLATLFGYLLYCASLSTKAASSLEKQQTAAAARTLWDDVWTYLLVVTLGGALSPLLMTLTATISSDTLYMMCFFLLLTNLVTHDYGASSGHVTQSLSFNAAMFASICLASRLPTSLHCFAIIHLAVVTFALWPLLRTSIQTRFGSAGCVLLTSALCVTSFVALLSVSLSAACLLLTLCFFISFLCPAWLIHMQKYKNNIYGPWDEAVIKD